MGHGSYKASDWAKLKESRGISETARAQTIFRKREMADKYNPRYVQMRESCDSADSPNATPIIIGFDVTGSMGYLAEEIAKNALNKTILSIYDKKPVTNPHILCAAIGDVCDNAPLQVSQFEADIRIMEQLVDLWLEMRGGDAPEDYNLLWYFADQHTRTDAYEKRGEKGFLFTIGDATVHAGLNSEGLKKVFGDDTTDKTNRDLLDAVSEKYEVFHIVCKNQSVFPDWQRILPGRVAFIPAQSIQYLSEVIISLMQIAKGMSRKDAVSQWPENVRPVVAAAVERIYLPRAAAHKANHDTAQNQPGKSAEAEKPKGFFDRFFKK